MCRLAFDVISAITVKKKIKNKNHYSPYLLMEVRDMLAEEGMLYDEVCFGTKATTQRSDTCNKRHMQHEAESAGVTMVFHSIIRTERVFPKKRKCLCHRLQERMSGPR